jgi:hypothetical protein
VGALRPRNRSRPAGYYGAKGTTEPVCDGQE